jgi:hypothetical protein
MHTRRTGTAQGYRFASTLVIAACIIAAVRLARDENISKSSPFIAANETESHKSWAVNVGTFEKDFMKIVSPEFAADFVSRLRRGEVVEFPNRYELHQVKGKFGGCFMDWDTGLD